MKYTKEHEKNLLEDVVYYLENGADKYFFMKPEGNDINKCVAINLNRKSFLSNALFESQSEDENFRQADSLESQWIKHCLEIKKYVSKEEFTKSIDYEIY